MLSKALLFSVVLASQALALPRPAPEPASSNCITLSVGSHQCGGMGWTGPNKCCEGHICEAQNPWYSMCVPVPSPNPWTTNPPTNDGPAPNTSVTASESTITATSTTSTRTSTVTASPTPPACNLDMLLGVQCGGIGYSGPTKCCGGYYCKKLNDWVSQCARV